MLKNNRYRLKPHEVVALEKMRKTENNQLALLRLEPNHILTVLAATILFGMSERLLAMIFARH